MSRQRLVRSEIVKKLISGMVLTTAMFAAPLYAQNDQPKPTDSRQPPATSSRQIPLRVQLVVARYRADKKVSSLPYTLSVVANDNDKTTMRMGVDVPIPNTVFSPTTEGGKTSSPITSYNYRSIGTNIDCSARTLEDGVFKLDLAVEDSSVFVADKDPGGMPAVAAPSVRRFTSTFNVLLRDGQTVQHTAATDPVSGEVLRVDVTLNVVK
jgi:hypothetical protein